jgi:tetratricopeptide (TPR) repeat protein
LVAAVGATAQEGLTGQDYRALVRRYQSGDPQAARELVQAGVALPRDLCRGGEECEAAAVLNLEAAALLLGARRPDDAWRLVDSTRRLVSGRSTDFAFEWLLAAGFLQQAPGDHARAYRSYAAALELRPHDPSALLARSTALEFAAMPDGFGGTFVVEGTLVGFLGHDDAPGGLSRRLAGTKSNDPYRRRFLDVLTRQYREILHHDSGQAEARLRLGRVLHERRQHGEALKELRAAAEATGDSFVAAVARLCLARLDPSAQAAADLYRSALAIDSSLQPAWLGLSQALQASGDYEGALGALEHALSDEEPRRNVWALYHSGRARAFPNALADLRARLRPLP